MLRASLSERFTLFEKGCRRQTINQASPPTLGRGNRRQRRVPPSISILRRRDRFRRGRVRAASGETKSSWPIGACYIPIGGELTVTRSQRSWCLRERPSLSSHQTT